MAIIGRRQLIASLGGAASSRCAALLTVACFCWRSAVRCFAHVQGQNFRPPRGALRTPHSTMAIRLMAFLKVTEIAGEKAAKRIAEWLDYDVRSPASPRAAMRGTSVFARRVTGVRSFPKGAPVGALAVAAFDPLALLMTERRRFPRPWTVGARLSLFRGSAAEH
jgi:hypothetical protein